MGKRSKLAVIFVLILVFWTSRIYSIDIVDEPNCKKIGNLDNVIYIPEISGIEKKYEYLIVVNQNELKPCDKDLRIWHAQNFFEEKINSVLLLGNNAPNIFLVATDNTIYFLDEQLNIIKDDFCPNFEIKKTLSVWDPEDKEHNFIIQSTKSIYCYSNDMEELWKYPAKNLDEEILLLSVQKNRDNVPIIFGHTKSKVFLVGLNGGEITKRNFSEVFSVHFLSEGIAVYCYEPNDLEGKKYALKMIRFDETENISTVYRSNVPLNTVTTGSTQPNLPHMIFFQEGTEFMAVNQNGMKYLENPIELNSQIKKIIIEDLDHMKINYEHLSSTPNELNFNEIVLICENEVIFCVPELFSENSNTKMRFIEIDRWYKDGLNNFFIPEGQANFPKRSFYSILDEICIARVMYDSWYLSLISDKIDEFIKNEKYNSANQWFEYLKGKKKWIEHYGYENDIADLESQINEGINEYKQKADQAFSMATQDFESGNYMNALDDYYHSLINYEKSGPNEETKKSYKDFLYCVEKIYEIEDIENFENKIKIHSYLFEIFDSYLYLWGDVIYELKNDESLNEKFRENIDDFDQYHFGALRSTLQEIEADAAKDRENGNLISARDKYSALIEPYEKYLENEQKANELRNKVNELDSKIQEKERNKKILIGLVIGLVIVGSILIIYFWKIKPPTKKEQKIGEKLTEGEKISKMKDYEREYKDYKEKCIISSVVSTAFCVIFGILWDLNPNLNIFIVLIAFLGLFSALVTICYFILYIISRNAHTSLEKELEKQIQKRESNKKNFREFFSNPETGDSNFIIVIGNAFEQYIEPLNEFLRIISEEHFNYTEIIPMYLMTEHLGKIKKGEREVKHFVEIDERSLELRDNEIKDVHKIGYNLLLVGFIDDNVLIKDLIDHGLSEADWEASERNFEFIPNAFIEGKNTIICSGKNTDAISNGLRKLLEKLYEEDR